MSSQTDPFRRTPCFVFRFRLQNFPATRRRKYSRFSVHSLRKREFIMNPANNAAEERISPRLPTNRMKKSWSTDSLSSQSGPRSCVCAPTQHVGSFRCRIHRHVPTNLLPDHVKPPAATELEDG
ncbi:hypothetical protein H6P81_003004 [Aristolochia fimbriata]|uniref:Uncharacterized protein n=1 Tax=Aristolochia fimbriata TaxID=158543 RepID=A0AAV7FCG4_ARIFI|nr:hypothetical protein H6P81_003004 [Aristolochia fimbriata]